MRRGGATIRVLAGVAAALTLAACGGAESPDIGAAAGDFEVAVTRADFPARQQVAGASDLVLAVTNRGDETLPRLAVTVWTGGGGAGASKPSGSFNVREGARTRPAWLPGPGYPKLLRGGVTLRNVDAAPGAGATVAQTDTFAFGALQAGRTRTIVWRVTPVRPGRYTLRYAIAAGLGGEARAVTAGGEPAGGRFRVTIGRAPRGACVVEAARPGACS